MDTDTLESTHSGRITRFRMASRLRGQNGPACPYIDHLKAAHARHAHLAWRERQARARAEALEQLPVYFFPEEKLVGMVYHTDSWPQVDNPVVEIPFAQQRVREELPENQELVELELFSDGAAKGHVTWHWDWILDRGVLGILEEYRLALSQPQDRAARDFYEGVILSLEALLRWNERHIEELRQKRAESVDDEHQRLDTLIALCERVPAHPARTFHEAVQSFYFQYLAVMRESPYGGNSPGRLDYFLWPYLESDLQKKRTTMEEARELIDELFIRLHERIQPYDGHVESIVVGGTHPDGSPAVTPLSNLMVESIIDLDQTHPSVYMRMPENPPGDFVKLAVHYLLKGGNRAQILNDDTIVKALSGTGMSLADARMYTCGGCMEITPQGMGSDLVFTGYQNVAKLLELVLTGGECLHTGKRLAGKNLPSLDNYENFEQLYQAFASEVERELNILCKRLDIYSEVLVEHRPLYLMSSLTADCLKRGREQQDGGARYHHYGTTPLGIPNAADALYAVKKAVFDEGFCSAGELLRAIRTNFAEHEALRQRLRHLPKFGQQHPEADAMANRVLTTICDTYAACRNRLDGRFKPIIFTFRWAPTAGAILGATADGQWAGKPIAQSLTPQTIGMTEGITAAMASHTDLPLEKVTGSSTSMWDLDPQWATPSTVETLLSTFLELGGQIFQGNMTEVDELHRAREHPEDHPNLIVRVGGFSARFVALNADVQDEIIHRYRHRG